MARIPLFPLANVVLFPGCLAPLHIFEPRYRQMAAAALSRDRTIGMVSVRPGHDEEMAGNPPVYDVGCAGVIAEHQQLPDGRYNIVLKATRRFRLDAELPLEGDRIYRIAETTPLLEPAGDTGRNAELRRSVIAHLERLVERSSSEGADPLERLLTLDDATFVNSLCQTLALPPEEKQGLLEAEDVAQRLDRLEGLLVFHLARAASPIGPESRTIN